MSTFIDLVNRYSAEWLTLAAGAVWQSTLLAGVVAAIVYALRASSPAVRYWLWQLVAIKLLVLPLWVVSLELPWPAEAVIAVQGPSPARGEVSGALNDAPQKPRSESTKVAAARPFDVRTVRWQSWLVVAWAAIVAAQVMRLVAQRCRLTRILRDCVPAEGELPAAVADVARRIELRRPPLVLLPKLDGSAFVCGILRPKLVLSDELLATLQGGDLRQVIAHELAHVKRRDLVWGWLPELARMLYFFHPVAHWASYRIRLERELACDQVAMSASGRGPVQYAETLVHVVGLLACPSVFRAAAVAGLDGNAPLVDSSFPSGGQEP